MKQYFYSILLLTALLFVACDEVPNNERLTYVEPPEVGRAVLIEDFTGQYCVNCPRATEEIERLVEQYGDSVVIAVAIHSGPFSKQNGVPSPLYTEVGDMYFSHWGLSGQPIGLVDRLFNSTPLSFTEWSAGVYYELTESPISKPPVSFFTSTVYDQGSRQASIDVQTIGLDSARVSGKLQVWLVEDSIDSFQLMPKNITDEHYNHMHVFRASVNDTWGDDVSVAHGEVARNCYSFTIDPAWIPAHCSFVVFLYDENGVRQVSKYKLTD